MVGRQLATPADVGLFLVRICPPLFSPTNQILQFICYSGVGRVVIWMWVGLVAEDRVVQVSGSSLT